MLRLHKPRLSLPVGRCLLGLAFILSACGGGGGAGGTTTPTTPTVPTSTLVLTLPDHGLKPAQLGLVVIAGDATSEAMAAYYQQARGVPAANVVKVSLPAGATANAALDADAFTQVKAAVDAAVPGTVQALLLVWRMPSQVQGSSCSMSITSAMAFGFDARYCGGCPATKASSYYDSESAQPFTELNMRPTMLLGTGTLADAKALIDRGVLADGSQPGGTGWLIRSTDGARSVRYTDFSPLPASWTGWLTLNYVNNSGGASADDVITGKTNVMFYFTGLASVSGLGSNTYRPGAVGDSLTSTGGALGGTLGQTLATDWLAAGLTASYGTVEEPCNYAEKFPRASVLLDHYWRGDTLIEAYWKSVQWPGQGLFVGEPLARPWPDTRSFSIVNGQYSISTRSWRPDAQYWVQYRKANQTDWTQLQTLRPARGAAQTLTSPLAPADASQIRFLGPCYYDLGTLCVLAQTP